MFGSNVLEVGIGIALLFLFVSLICTSFQEGIEMILKSRASDLEHGIRLLLGDQEGKGTAKTFFDHPLIYSLFRGEYEPAKLARNRKGDFSMPRAARSGLPSYIPAANFSAALIDLVATGKISGDSSADATGAKPLPGDLEGWRMAAAAIGNKQVREAVRSAFELGGGDVDAARANLETWYNGTMDRVSGWYKRRSQRSLFLVGLLTAMGLNIDTITIVRELSESSALRQAALSAAEKSVAAPSQKPAAGVLDADYERARNAITAIGYPVGWTPPPQLRACAGGEDKPGVLGNCKGVPLALAAAGALAGWIATALAIMLGAPFWFDVLNKFMVIRSTVKSYEKSPPEGSEDRKPAPVVAAPRARGMP